MRIHHRIYLFSFVRATHSVHFDYEFTFNGGHCRDLVIHWAPPRIRQSADPIPRTTGRFLPCFLSQNLI